MTQEIDFKAVLQELGIESVNPGVVITSYSIHYTKLYDGIAGIR